MTQPGMILGTAAYMSPEQARGLAVDKRTDIWAFGCVLYETLTGRAVFSGDTLSDTIAAILDREPHWKALPEHTPSSVRRLLRRCLEKDPKRRLPDIADARLEIDEAETTPSDAATPGRRCRPASPASGHVSASDGSSRPHALLASSRRWPSIAAAPVIGRQPTSPATARRSCFPPV